MLRTEGLGRNMRLAIHMVISEDDKDIYRAAAEETYGIHVNFFTRKDTSSWKPWAKQQMMEIGSRPGVLDATPFWEKFEALKVATEQPE